LFALRLLLQYNNTVTVMMRTAIAEAEQIKQNAHATVRPTMPIAHAHSTGWLVTGLDCAAMIQIQHHPPLSLTDGWMDGWMHHAWLAQARRNTILAEAAAYAQVKDELGLDATQLQAYRWYHTMMDTPSGKVLVNMEGGSIVNVAGGG
jgi:hypothetical protein